MADVSVLNVSGGSVDSITSSSTAATETTGQIPCENGKDNRMAVLVKNDDIAAITFTVKAPTSGGGVRSSLGDLKVDISAADQALIPLFDTARFKVLADNDIDFEISDYQTSGFTGTIGSISITAIQL